MQGINTPAIAASMQRHERVAFQLSGGRDSVAALYAMRDWWGLMTVYHLDTGDQFPEVASVIGAISRDVAVHIVRSSAQAFRDTYGHPADVVPVDAEPLGRMVSGGSTALVSRYTCCANVIMAPMHQRMREDGITLIVRGQRASDWHQAPAPQGVDIDGFELLFPIHDWRSQDVDAYIAHEGLPVAPFYAHGMNTTPDCMGCTAWLGDGRLRYMDARYPAEAHALRQKIRGIRDAVAQQLNQFDDEVYP